MTTDRDLLDAEDEAAQLLATLEELGKENGRVRAELAAAHALVAQQREELAAARGGLAALRRAVGAYAAQHKADRCACSICDVTRASMALADQLLEARS